MSEEVKLLGILVSPYTCRVSIAFKLKGVSYEHVEENIKNKSPELLKYNPIHKKLPVLLHNGKPLPESLIIVEYIDETWKENPILPQDPHQRATVRFWAKYADDKCIITPFRACWSEGKEQENLLEEACENLKTLENELKDKRFFGGEEIGLVDIAATFVAFWLPASQEASGVEFFTAEKFPKLYQWADEFVNHSVVRESLPPKEMLVAYLKARYGKATAPK